MSRKLPFLSLKKRREFLALKKGRQVRSAFFLMQISQRDSNLNHSDLFRLGFTVSKKNGNAVKRSRIKRRLKEAARQTIDWSELKNYDCNIIAYPQALNAPFKDLVKAVKKAFSAIK